MDLVEALIYHGQTKSIGTIVYFVVAPLLTEFGPTATLRVLVVDRRYNATHHSWNPISTGASFHLEFFGVIRRFY